MKYKINLFLVIIIIITLISCEESEIGIKKNSHRIKEIIKQRVSSSAVDEKTLFTYNEEKIVKIEYLYKFEEEWELMEFDSIVYTDNKIIITHYYEVSDGPAISEKEELIIRDNKIIEATLFYYSQSFEPTDKVVYGYEGKNVVKAEYFSYHNENWVLRDKDELSYDDNLVIEYCSYTIDYEGNSYLDYKEIFSYENKRLVEWYRSYPTDSENWINSLKFEYLYQGNLQMESAIYDFVDNEWVYDYSFYYNYNEFDYLEKEELVTTTKTYTYEKGHGNYSLFIITPVYRRYNLPSPKSDNDDNKYKESFYHYIYLF